MANRQVTYTLLLDDQAFGPLKAKIAEVRRELNGLSADARRVGSLSGGGSVGTLQTGPAQIGAVSRSPLGPNSDSREMISRLGLISRQLDAIRQLLSNGTGGPARYSGAAPMGGGGGGGNFARTERRVEGFIRGGQLTQIGHTIGGVEGSFVAGAGDIMSGAAAGGPAGAALGAVKAFTSLAHALNESAAAASKAAEAKRTEALVTHVEAQGMAGRQRSVDRARRIAGTSVSGSALQLATIGDERSDIGERMREIEFNRAKVDNISRFAAGDQYGITSKEDQKFLGEAGQKLKAEEAKEELDLRKRIFELRRSELDIQRAQVATERDIVETAQRGYRQQIASINELIERENERLKDQKAGFGSMSKSAQNRTKRIAEKLDAGGSLTASELRFARKSQLLQEDASKEDQRRADAAGFSDSASLRNRSAQLKIDQLQGQKTLVEERLKIGDIQVKYEIEITEKAINEGLSNQFEKSAREVFEQTRQAIIDAAAAAAGKRALAG